MNNHRSIFLVSEDALMTWANTTSGGVSLVQVQWSRSRPSVFFTMDSESVLYIWYTYVLCHEIYLKYINLTNCAKYLKTLKSRK